MPNSHGIEPAALPSGVLELLRQTGAAAMAVLIGAAAGLALARWMRGRSLHHRCAVAALALVVLVHGMLGTDLALMLAGCCASALKRARRWHREDLRAGEDLAAAALERRGPLALVATLTRRIALERLLCGSTIRRAAGGGHAAGIALGHDRAWRLVALPIGHGRPSVHSLVVGATGSGKTVTQTRIAVGAIESGMGAVVLDPKGDERLRGALADCAGRCGRQFIEWSPAGDWVYNPFASGSDTELADKALAGERFTEPHYMRQAQRYLAHAVRALRLAGERQLSLGRIVWALRPDALELLARELPGEEGQRLHEYLDGLSSRQQAELSGVRDRLAILAESDVGPWLDPERDGARCFELGRSLADRAIVYFSLQCDRWPLLGHMLAAAIVQDLQTVVASRQSSPLSSIIVIDEFSALGVEHVVRLFGRARSAGFSLLLGTQEFSDLRPPGGERLLEQVVGNLGLLIAHRQVVQESAQAVAALAGSAGTWRFSQHTGERTTRTRVRRPRLQAEEVRELAAGRAAVIELGLPGPSRIVEVFAPEIASPRRKGGRR